MRLFVYLLQAKDLPVEQSFTKLRVGKSKFKSRISRCTTSPVWNQEFVFKLHAIDNDDELVVSVYHHDDDHFGFFSGCRDLAGSARIPLSSLPAADNRTLPPTWYPLESPNHGRFINVDCGQILLTISLDEKGHEVSNSHIICAPSDVNGEASKEMEYSSTLSHSHGVYGSKAPFFKISEGKHVMKACIGHVAKFFHVHGETGKITDDSSDFSTTLSDYEESLEEHAAPACSFKEAIELMQSEHDDQEMPENLQGGVLLDEVYKVPPNDLNMFLFAPDCQFQKDLSEFQGTADVEEGPWTWKQGDGPCLSRIVTYTKAATKLVKAVKATEEQVYLKANGKEFAVFSSVSTPEVPYGNIFKINVLYKILPGSEQSEGGESSRLIISWGINFQQNTMMRSMIEGGARQGLKDSFDQFSELLARNFAGDTTKDIKDRSQMLASLQTKKQSTVKLACEYFCDYTLISAIFMALYVSLHIILCKYGKCKGLEFEGFDLPDSFGEVFVCGVLVLLLERVYYRVSHFINSQLQKGSDSGVKAQGDGWILTVGLVEGVSLPALDTNDSPDPYVVFTSNGKTRASSVKLQCHDPHWNEIIEFDAMEEPPSVLVVEVFDFDGPFNQATSLGHVEINLLKHTSIELADLWVSLEGKLAQSFQTKLHLRIFLDNNNGFETIREYLTKMEKEVGKKLNLRSPHKNSTFQKLFELPPEEFLISAFTCHLRRKMPLQGRLFLSARIVGFYANLFGHKTKFFFLWEDIEDIQVLPPSLASVGSPSLVIVLRKGRGFDARHGAKSQDEEGRLKFYFQSFVSFDAANRTIMALWRTRTLTPDQKAQIADEQQDPEEMPVDIEDAPSLLEGEEAKMYKIYSAELPLSVTFLMRLFEGGDFEQKIMGKSGCLNYTTTKWEVVKPGISERRISYRFNHHVSISGGEVTCRQQKSSLRDEKGWVVNEVMVLHDVPFCDHFRVHFEYEIEKSELAQNASKCDVNMRITWLRSTICEQTITQNLIKKFSDGFEEILELAKKETLFTVIDGASN